MKLQQVKTKTNKRPPKKIVNPEYSEWMLENRKPQFIDQLYMGAQLLFSGTSNPFAAYEAASAERAIYFPEDFNADIPEIGAWILVKRPPFTEVKISRFSVWYALPDQRPGERGFVMHLAKILTPDGSLWLWPHEYSVVKVENYLEFIGEGYEFQFLSEAMEFHTDQLHYVMSRGVPRPKALQLLLPTLNTQTIGWLEPSEAVQAAFS